MPGARRRHSLRPQAAGSLFLRSVGGGPTAIGLLTDRQQNAVLLPKRYSLLQSHPASDVVLGQFFTDGNGPENGIVLSSSLQERKKALIIECTDDSRKTLILIQIQAVISKIICIEIVPPFRIHDDGIEVLDEEGFNAPVAADVRGPAQRHPQARIRRSPPR